MAKKISKRVIGMLLGILSIIFTLSGCSIKSNAKETSAKQDETVRIAYLGTIDEAPLYIAAEKGFFDKEGIKVELVKSDEDSLQEQIKTGTVDGVTAGSDYFKYIEEGLPLTITAGLHAGCIRLIVPLNSKAAVIRDLKKMRIGVKERGEGSMVFASMLLRKNNVNPARDVEWKYLGEQSFDEALKNGEIDAACIWEPSEKASVRVNGAYTTIFRTYIKDDTQKGHNHSSKDHFTKSFVGLSESLIKEQPKKAASITRAWLSAANWIAANQEEATRLVTEKKYVSGSYEDHYDTLSSYMWTPGIKSAKQYIKYYIKEQKANGLLSASLDEKKFYKKAFKQVLPDFE